MEASRSRRLAKSAGLWLYGLLPRSTSFVESSIVRLRNDILLVVACRARMISIETERARTPPCNYGAAVTVVSTVTRVAVTFPTRWSTWFPFVS